MHLTSVCTVRAVGLYAYPVFWLSILCHNSVLCCLPCHILSSLFCRLAFRLVCLLVSQELKEDKKQMWYQNKFPKEHINIYQSVCLILQSSVLTLSTVGSIGLMNDNWKFKSICGFNLCLYYLAHLCVADLLGKIPWINLHMYLLSEGFHP